MLVQTSEIFVISMVIVGHEDNVESATNYSCFPKEAIAALNRKSCLLMPSHDKFIPDFWCFKKVTVIKKLQTFFTEVL